MAILDLQPNGLFISRGREAAAVGEQVTRLVIIGDDRQRVGHLADVLDCPEMGVLATGILMPDGSDRSIAAVRHEVANRTAQIALITMELGHVAATLQNLLGPEPVGQGLRTVVFEPQEVDNMWAS